MRLARFSLNDSPRYAFVQKDETDGKDYLIELDGHPLAGDQVKPTGARYPVCLLYTSPSPRDTR